MAARVELSARVGGGHEDSNDFVADEVEAVGQARGDRVGVARVAIDHQIVIAPSIKGTAAAVLGHANFVDLEPDRGRVGPNDIVSHEEGYQNGNFGGSIGSHVVLATSIRAASHVSHDGTVVAIRP